MKPKVMELMHTMHKLNKLRLQIPPPEGGGAWGSLGKLETDFILPDSGGLAIRHPYEAQGYGANAYNA